MKVVDVARIFRFKATVCGVVWNKTLRVKATFNLSDTGHTARVNLVLKTVSEMLSPIPHRE